MNTSPLLPLVLKLLEFLRGETLLDLADFTPEISLGCYKVL